MSAHDIIVQGFVDQHNLHTSGEDVPDVVEKMASSVNEYGLGVDFPDVNSGGGMLDYVYSGFWDQLGDHIESGVGADSAEKVAANLLSEGLHMLDFGPAEEEITKIAEYISQKENPELYLDIVLEKIAESPTSQVMTPPSQRTQPYTQYAAGETRKLKTGEKPVGTNFPGTKPQLPKGMDAGELTQGASGIASFKRAAEGGGKLDDLMNFLKTTPGAAAAGGVGGAGLGAGLGAAIKPTTTVTKPGLFGTKTTKVKARNPKLMALMALLGGGLGAAGAAGAVDPSLLAKAKGMVS